MKTALFPGTFDPPTLGHLDIIERAAKLVDTLHVGIALNTGKGKPLFTIQERVEMMRELTKHHPNIVVGTIPGLVADFVQNNNIQVIVRGLRSASDCDSEFSMAMANRAMSEVETLFLVASDHLSHLSGTLIREIASAGNHLERFVPKAIVARVYAAAKT
jgi:pantetheine-phosphate adenylyltransferase